MKNINRLLVFVIWILTIIKYGEETIKTNPIIFFISVCCGVLSVINFIDFIYERKNK